jgi:hypothetical protein
MTMDTFIGIIYLLTLVKNKLCNIPVLHKHISKGAFGNYLVNLQQ